ncbi:hypothetical protein IF1G_05028 [Cordyceps javanica]|uniref:DUF7707 domain-containing protein n=1 Tax=Cordyceps javanica TaxID=43265 RepID=A0A545V411_9HYPO|nr:hypothetical protein IF1G_05028 [Cordyceps javanica]TQW07732.1 hypothetical protein IF2G_04893 [Cordyceps javanica]
MVSFKTTGFVAAAALATLAQADYEIDPTTVPFATRGKSSCNPLETLKYGCLCGNNKQPNVSEYSLSIPYYVCTEWGRQCVNGCGSNNVCASDCLQNHPCGATNPERRNASATSSQGATASKTGSDGIYTGPAGSANDGSAGKKTGAGAALEVGRSYGFAVVFVGMFAGFAML